MFGRSSTQNAVAVQAVPNTNPFGTLPAMPQMSIGRVGTTPSIQYGISSMPVISLSCFNFRYFLFYANLRLYLLNFLTIQTVVNNWVLMKGNEFNVTSFQALDKPAPVRISSLLTSRHLSQRRIRLPVRKYHSKNDGPRVSIFSCFFLFHSI